MATDFQKLFIREALRTESKDFEKIMERLQATKTIRLLHASMGMVTEAAEMLDALKKFIFYGKTLDVINLKEEIGDEFWYQAIACDELGSDFTEIQQMVLKKLAKRYDLANKKEFTEEKAVNRNLVEERATMEGTINQIAGVEVIKEQLPQELLHFSDDEKTMIPICKPEAGQYRVTLGTNKITCVDCRNIINFSKY